jgi:hypothetical protein
MVNTPLFATWASSTPPERSSRRFMTRHGSRFSGVERLCVDFSLPSHDADAAAMLETVHRRSWVVSSVRACPYDWSR